MRLTTDDDRRALRKVFGFAAVFLLFGLLLRSVFVYAEAPAPDCKWGSHVMPRWQCATQATNN